MYHWKKTGGKVLSGLLSAAMLQTAVCSVSVGISAAEVELNYAKALQYSIYFYDANMCGTEVSENTRYTWRGDCHTYDAQVPMDTTSTNLSSDFLTQNKDVLDPDGDGYIDVSGGFHDAGDHVKFGMPENYSASTLGWGYYEFRDAYTALGQDDHMETILRYFNDYLMKCTFRDENGTVIAHCYQVGDGDIDHAYWNAPEVDEMERKAFFLTQSKPQTDYTTSAAASLAVNYLNFKDTDPAYAETCLDYAKALFTFANENPKELSDNDDGPKRYYRSEKWTDDYCWAAAWLFLATEDVSYLEAAMPYVDYYAPSGWMHCWNDVWNGAISLLGEIDLQYPELDLQNMYRTAQNKSEYEDADFWNQIQKSLDQWAVNGNYDTAGGYAFFSTWGSARYNTAAQLVALVYDKYKNNGQPSVYSEWAKSQMDYLMGENPLNRAYIVGYSENAAKYPHHRAASGLTKCEDTSEHKHVLYGALVGGPDGNDNHIDITADYIYNEVTIDYNAAFVGACAGLYEYYGDSSMQVTPDFPPVEENSGENGGNDFYVRAYAVDDPQSGGAGVTKLAMLVETNSVQPKNDLSVRYYFSIAEMEDKAHISEVKTYELYDQTETETDYDGVISGPFQYDASFDENIYYFEVKWDGYKIANSNKKYQCAVGLYWGDKWDPTNDWSYQGLEVLDSTNNENDGKEARTDYICVYSSGELIGGIEPNGTEPDQGAEITTTTTTATMTTTTTTTTATTTTTTTITTSDTTETIPITTETTTTISGTDPIDTTTTTTVATTPEPIQSSAADNVQYGDVTGDGKTDLLDIIFLNKSMAGLVTLSESAQKCSDCSGDGITDEDDCAILMQFVVMIIPSLPWSGE